MTCSVDNFVDEHERAARFSSLTKSTQLWPGGAPVAAKFPAKVDLGVLAGFFVGDAGAVSDVPDEFA